MSTMWAKYAIYEAIDNIPGICYMPHIENMPFTTLRCISWKRSITCICLNRYNYSI